MAESAREMEMAMKRLWDSGEGADLTLVCQGKTWKVHSSYLWPRSSWFRAACKGGFKEAETRRIDFPEEEPSMVYRMLQHFYLQAYTGNLGLDPFWSRNDSWAKTRLHVHVQMYSLGDKYDVPSLKKEAARRFGEDVRIPGDRKRETRTLLSVVRQIYTTTPASDRRLRALVVQHIFQRYDTASKHLVEELDTALEVRHFAREIIALHRERPTMRETAIAIASEVDRIWHRYVRPLLAATISALPTAASLRARLLAAGMAIGRILCTCMVGFLLFICLIGLVTMLVERTLASVSSWASLASIEKAWKDFAVQSNS